VCVWRERAGAIESRQAREPKKEGDSENEKSNLERPRRVRGDRGSRDVPAATAASKKTPTPSAEASAQDLLGQVRKDREVNLNTADEKDIAGAKGVGEKLAKELVKNRPYRRGRRLEGQGRRLGQAASTPSRRS